MHRSRDEIDKMHFLYLYFAGDPDCLQTNKDKIHQDEHQDHTQEQILPCYHHSLTKSDWYKSPVLLFLLMLSNNHLRNQTRVNSYQTGIDFVLRIHSV